MQTRITYTDVAWFRAKRTGLASPFDSAPAAARGILGAQAQVEAPARWALSLRTQEQPTADAISEALLTTRSLVRAWGQRDTVHIYAADDWHLFAQAQVLWPASARRGPMPTDNELSDFVRLIDARATAFTRSDLIEAAPGRLVDAFRAEPVNTDAPERMAITRLIWAAGREGWLSSVHMVGREQAYAARATWLPAVPWPRLSATEATLEVLRRYLAAWGPARAQDAAHFLGARVTDVRGWLAALEPELVEVAVDGQKGHLLRRSDVAELVDGAPGDAGAWPARLLPAFDTQMMSHANKDPLVANADDRPRIWGKAAVVRPTVFAQGRFVATWAHKAQRKAVHITVDPLDGADVPTIASAIADALARDGQALARHLGAASMKAN